MATGQADTLLDRAAHVALKEARPLVIVPRETPFSRLHLDHLTRLAWAGATVLPASPGFYHRPRTVLEVVDHLCAKVLGVIGVPQQHVRPWDGGRGARRENADSAR